MNEVDHLVVAAATLEQGAQWCERVLAATPTAGGKHAGMGTHNRLLAVGSTAFPQAYLEIIAHDPDAPAPARPRWFGLDDAALLLRLRERPRLLHVVARGTHIETTLEALRVLGLDAGQPVAAERASAHGVFRWRIAGRSDGRLLCGGALPTLIEWQGMHPAQHLPASGVALRALHLGDFGGLSAPVAAALALQGVPCSADGAALQAEFDTPRGMVRLSSEH
ncbi:MAG TPA: VOC family protein [Rubrivivax sp.]|nr:VOC family protein [Rubrivivax sp.]